MSCLSWKGWVVRCVNPGHDRLLFQGGTAYPFQPLQECVSRSSWLFREAWRKKHDQQSFECESRRCRNSGCSSLFMVITTKSAACWCTGSKSRSLLWCCLWNSFLFFFGWNSKEITAVVFVIFSLLLGYWLPTYRKSKLVEVVCISVKMRNFK